jgi:hypothetical protein
MTIAVQSSMISSSCSCQHLQVAQRDNSDTHNHGVLSLTDSICEQLQWHYLKFSWIQNAACVLACMVSPSVVVLCGMVFSTPMVPAQSLSQCLACLICSPCCVIVTKATNKTCQALAQPLVDSDCAGEIGELRATGVERQACVS